MRPTTSGACSEDKVITSSGCVSLYTPFACVLSPLSSSIYPSLQFLNFLSCNKLSQRPRTCMRVSTYRRGNCNRPKSLASVIISIVHCLNTNVRKRVIVDCTCSCASSKVQVNSTIPEKFFDHSTPPTTRIESTAGSENNYDAEYSN